jgi:hypothetical protein
MGELTCHACPSNPKYTHSQREHDVADAWIPALVDYIKVDAFASLDRPLSYKDAVTKFSLDTSVRRAGRVLDAVEWILKSRGWPIEACAGVAAYVVNSSTGEPGDGWKELWTMHPRDAREAARSHVRELALAD